MVTRILSLLFLAQKALLFLSCVIFKPFVKKDEKLWVVGAVEIANNTKTIAACFDKAFTVNLIHNKYYAANRYDVAVKSQGVIGTLIRWIIGPILLGYLVNKSNSFFYIGRHGFLYENADGRAFEFSFLKKRDKKLVTFFTGTDIRSIKLSLEHARRHDLDVMATYQSMINPALMNDVYDEKVKKIARSADEFSDYIFNAEVDQISYIKRDVHPFQYFFPDDKFVKNDAKFAGVSKFLIIHAPSSPFLKGTPIIRAAIKKLKLLGYEFDYQELINCENDVVVQNLRKAHIVINELYAFLPGVFGVEAMASHAALLTSADKTFEPTLPDGSNEAWVVTHYWEIFDNLKNLLDHPSLVKEQADRGFAWAAEHASVSQSKRRLRSIIGAD